MTIVGVGSASGSPGATTVSILLASAFGGEHSMVVDADRDGGDVSFLLDLDPLPGLATLALEGRHGITPELIAEHAQRSWLVPGVRALVGVTGRAQASVLDWVLPALLVQLAGCGSDVVVDLGRIGCATQLEQHGGGLDHLVMVCRNDTASLVHARSALLALNPCGPTAEVVVIGAEPAAADELAAALGHPVAATLPVVPLEPPRPGRSRPMATDTLLPRVLSGQGALVTRLRRSVDALAERLAFGSFPVTTGGDGVAEPAPSHAVAAALDAFGRRAGAVRSTTR